jgi:enolase-phosphatase E1
MRALLTDIEGTTTDVAFVHRVLFPIARREMPRFVRAHAADPEHAASLLSVRRAVARDGGRSDDSVTLDEIVDRLVAWIDADAKETALKAIQGAIWREAYASGTLRSHVYDDVAPAFRRLRAAGVPIYVFSSGSVDAQRLLFANTVAGDLSGCLAGMFDTTTGPKREAASYARIAAELGLPPRDVLFVSDVLAELDAARSAGMDTLWIVRPGTAPGGSGGHARADDFRGLAATCPP